MTRVVYLTPKQNKALEVCKQFFAENDAIPNDRMLGKLLSRSRSSGSHYLFELYKSKVLVTNAQGGLKFTREPYRVVEVHWKKRFDDQ